jgi:hypothetical protein
MPDSTMPENVAEEDFGFDEPEQVPRGTHPGRQRSKSQKKGSTIAVVPVTIPLADVQLSRNEIQAVGSYRFPVSGEVRAECYIEHVPEGEFELVLGSEKGVPGRAFRVDEGVTKLGSFNVKCGQRFDISLHMLPESAPELASVSGADSVATIHQE